MAQFSDNSAKLLQYIPPTVLVVSIIAGYVSLQERVNSLQTRHDENEKVITTREVKLRLDSIQSDVTEIKQDVKEIGRKTK